MENDGAGRLHAHAAAAQNDLGHVDKEYSAIRRLKKLLRVVAARDGLLICSCLTRLFSQLMPEPFFGNSSHTDLMQYRIAEAQATQGTKAGQSSCSCLEFLCKSLCASKGLRQVGAPRLARHTNEGDGSAGPHAQETRRPPLWIHQSPILSSPHGLLQDACMMIPMAKSLLAFQKPTHKLGCR